MIIISLLVISEREREREIGDKDLVRKRTRRIYEKITSRLIEKAQIKHENLWAE